MKDLQLGDLVVSDDVEKGLSIHNRHNGELRSWLNQKGEIALLDWLAEKHGRTFEPNIVTTEANRKGWRNVDKAPQSGEKD